MEIHATNLDNEKEVRAIIDLIYASFVGSNKQDSTERLIQRMEKLYGPGYDYSATLQHFKKSDIFLIAKEENDIIGIVRGTPEKLSNLYISQDQQSRGIGKQLLQRFEAEAKNRWSSSIRLKSSAYALPFYLHNGYTVEDGNRLVKIL